MEKVVTGFVLRVVNYQESDAIITLLSKDDGIVTFKARGILKQASKNASACQLYTSGEYTLTSIQESSHYILKSASIIATLAVLYSDIKASILLAFCAESILRVEEYSSEFAFSMFSKVFEHLKQNNNFLTIVLIILKYNMNFLGIMLEASSCVSCGTQKRIISVSYEEGGFLCEKCNSEINAPKFSADYLKNFRYVILARIDNIDDFAVDEAIGKSIFKDFVKFLENSAGIKFKSLELVADLYKIHL